MTVRTLSALSAWISLSLLAACATTPMIDVAPPANSSCASTPIDMPADTQFGALEFLGGVELVGDAGFGGLSGLTAQDTAPSAGDPVLLHVVADEGAALTLQVERDIATNELTVICSPLSKLSDPWAPAQNAPKIDAEGLALLPGDRWRYLVSFERRHRIEIHDPIESSLSKAVAGPSLGDVSALEDNLGLEALATLPSGLLIAGGENVTALGRPHPVWRFFPDPNVDAAYADANGPAFSMTASGPGYGLVGFEATPLGNLLVLERFYTPATGTLIRLGWLKGGAADGARGEVTPSPLARIKRSSPIPVDNFEGVAATRAPGGSTLVWIVSDDNFSNRQKTLLYLFAFDEKAFASGQSVD